VRVPNPGKKEIAFVLFDPNSMIMKTVVFRKSWDELKQQALHAPAMLDRYDALLALKETPLETKRALLTEMLGRESFHAVKAEAAAQLMSDTDPKSMEALGKLFGQSHPAPKLAMIKGMNGREEAWKNLLEKGLHDSSYDVVTASLDKLCKAFP